MEYGAWAGLEAFTRERCSLIAHLTNDCRLWIIPYLCSATNAVAAEAAIIAKLSWHLVNH